MKYTKEKLEEAAKISKAVSEVCRNLGMTYVSGSMQTHISSQLKRYEIDTSHFTGQGWNKGHNPYNKRKSEEILIKRSSGRREKAAVLRNALISIGRPYKCEGCNNTGIWLGNKLILEVHHIDENPLNNIPENLSFQCPNCHSVL